MSAATSYPYMISTVLSTQLGLKGNLHCIDLIAPAVLSTQLGLKGNLHCIDLIAPAAYVTDLLTVGDHFSRKRSGMQFILVPAPPHTNK